ncbi:MAG: helix-turn-helix domain-containing protein [Legionellaceae bacterium]|nr:helix-turn-helix domain-containing protein [Legionellaceae bacterium]
MKQIFFTDKTFLAPCKQGFKLSLCSDPMKAKVFSIEQLFSLPYDVFMLDLEGKTLKINQVGADICGFDSPEKAMGQTIVHADACETAEVLLDNCQQVLHTETTQLYDEVLRISHKAPCHLFSIKQPLYDAQEILMGSVGVSIIVGQHPIATALQTLTKLGFLISPEEKQMKESKESIYLNLAGVQLTLREQETLQWMAKGYSAKMIAKELSISHRTIEDYQRQLKEKFNVSSKQALLKKVL